jgi:hypothetical protein
MDFMQIYYVSIVTLYEFCLPIVPATHKVTLYAGNFQHNFLISGHYLSSCLLFKI